MKVKMFSAMNRRLQLAAVILLMLGCSKNEDEPNPDPKPDEKTELSITKIEPDYGEAGDEIIITGTGFSATASENAVSLDDKTAEVVSAGATQIKIKAPADASHGLISVKVKDKTASSKDKFYYHPVIDNVSPLSGKTGDAVTISGKHYIADKNEMEVHFNGVKAAVTSATATKLEVTVPEGAATGFITVALKGRAPVKGPEFTVTAVQESDDMFTVLSGNVTATRLVGSGEVFIVDDQKNVMYALSSDRKKILKVDLSTNSSGTLLENTAPFLLGNSASPFYPSSMALSGDGSYLYVLCTTNNSVSTQTNLFRIHTGTAAVTPVGARKAGMNMGGLTGGGARIVLYVDNKENVYTKHYDADVMKSASSLTKFSPDLSSYSRLFTNNFNNNNGDGDMVRIDDKSFRVLHHGLFSGYKYADITDGVAGSESPQPAGISGYYLLSRSGAGNYRMIKRGIGYSEHILLSLANDWNTNTEKGRVKIEKGKTAPNGIEFLYDIDRMWADGKGNFYVGVNMNIMGNFGVDEHSGIYKLEVK